MYALLLLATVGTDWQMGAIEARLTSLERRTDAIEARVDNLTSFATEAKGRGPNCTCTACECGQAKATPAPAPVQPAPVVRYESYQPAYQATYSTPVYQRRGVFRIFGGGRSCGPMGCN